MIAFLSRLFRLLRLCASGPRGRVGLLYLAAVLGLGFLGIWITVRMIAWSAAFYNAIQRVDGPEILTQIGVFGLLISASATLYLVGRYLQKLLEITWRQRLTEIALDRWLSDHAYWRLRAGNGSGVEIDNPDQRVAEDCRIFVERATGEGIDFVNAVVAVVSYFTVLWGLSTFTLAFEVAGVHVEIPRYMVWAAPIYVALSSGLTHWLGAPLKPLNFEQQKREADFRFALAHLRESAEAVALHRGEAAERRSLDQRFAAIAANWRSLINRELILGCFTRPYHQTVLRIPMFLALPAFIAGKVTLGGLMQVAQAFSNVVTTLSWFIFSYRDLAELAATASRLDHFMAATDSARASPSEIVVAPSSDGFLRVEGLRLRSPDGTEIADIPDFAVGPGECLWISGPSGFGKSTLLKAIAGFWRHGSGAIGIPEGNMSFLPQRPYVPLGGLAAAAAYPDMPEDSAEQVRHVLDGLGATNKSIGDSAPTQASATAQLGLSGGELQKLALRRLQEKGSAWVLLDEPTSALDDESERAHLSAFRRRLPDASIIIVSHQRPKGISDLKELAFRTNPDLGRCSPVS